MPTAGLYVAMSYLYGVRFTAEEDDLILSLRKVGPLMKNKRRRDLILRSGTLYSRLLRYRLACAAE